MAGTEILIASILRRDWLRVAIWAAGLIGLLLYVVIAFQAIYSTDADLAGYASVADSPVARAFNGPGYGLDPPSLGAVISNESVGFLATAIALMSVFLITRNTRAEEEDGRAELIASTGIGRHARLSAAALAVGAVNLAIGLVLIAVLAFGGLDPYGSLVYGAAVAGCGIVFAALALVAAQVSSHARVATAIAGGALGAAYLVRALGDIDQSGLSWLSPIGWAQAARPYAGERPAVLLLFVGTALLLVAIAVVLERRRDLGAGLIGSRPGPPRGRRYQAALAGLAFRLQRVAIASWLLAAVVLGFAYGTVTVDIERLIDESPEFAAYLTQAEGDLVDSYFATILFVVALVATGFLTQSLLRLRSEETSGRAEALLATGLSRTRWTVGYLIVAAGGAAAVMALGGFSIGAGYAVVGGEAASMVTTTLAALAWLPAILVAIGLVYVLVGHLPRLTVAAWLLLAVYFFLGFFGEALDIPGWILGVSPFEHVPDVPAVPFTVAAPALLSLLGAALTAAGIRAIRRRDIG